MKTVLVTLSISMLCLFTHIVEGKEECGPKDIQGCGADPAPPDKTCPSGQTCPRKIGQDGLTKNEDSQPKLKRAGGEGSTPKIKFQKGSGG